MARQRDYRAEYAARQARSLEKFGVSYNVQRRIAEKAEASELVTRQKALEALEATRSADVIRDLLEAQARAHAEGSNQAYDELDYSPDELADLRDQFPELFYYHLKR